MISEKTISVIICVDMTVSEIMAIWSSHLIQVCVFVPIYLNIHVVNRGYLVDDPYEIHRVLFPYFLFRVTGYTAVGFSAPQILFF